MCNVVSKQQHQITSLKSALSRLSLNYSGTLIWKISDFSSKMGEAKNKEGMELVSPPFYTSQYGYKLQVKQYYILFYVNIFILAKIPECESFKTVSKYLPICRYFYINEKLPVFT